VPEYSVRLDLPVVRLDRSEFEQLIDIVVEEFAPGEPILRIKDKSGYGPSVRANSVAEFLTHPDLPGNLHMVHISARDKGAGAGQRHISVVLYNSGPDVTVEAEDPDWAYSAARTIHYFLSRHRPWHFLLHGNVVLGLVAGAGLSGILIYGIRLLYRILTWNFTADFLLMSLAGVAGSVAALFAAFLPQVEIQVANDRDPFLVKMTNSIYILGALAVALLIARHWA
jgi:hypothetical protein